MTTKESEDKNELWFQSILPKIKSKRPKERKEPKQNMIYYIGPAFLIAMACLDPGNLSGDIAVGQKTNYRLLWLLIISGLLCYYFQSLALTIGVYTQKDLSQLCRIYYPFRWNFSIWLMTEVALMASDTQEVLGTAIALKIIFGIDIFYGVFVSLLLVFVMLFTQNKGQKFFEKIFALFISIMGICFFYNFFIIDKNWEEIFLGLIPSIQIQDFGYGISLLGAILMPQNLFLHSTLVNTRKINRQNK
jgi:NRAMP (natural resistance-associated macrophage protein)-like metal ion transporter